LQADEAVLEITVSPRSDGVAVAMELRGDLEIGRMILRGGA
jgi:hypothetical protein